MKATSADIVGSWAGLRPLLAAGRHARSADLSRRHAVRVAPSGVVTVTGGKLTTYRRMAADAVDAAVRVLGNHTPSSATKHLPLFGSDGVDPDAAEHDHLVGRYGSEAAAVQNLVDADPELGEPLVPGLSYLRAEAVYAARHEMARTLDDVLSRRTRARARARRVARRGAGRRRADRARARMVRRRTRARGLRLPAGRGRGACMTRSRKIAVVIGVLAVMTVSISAPGCGAHHHHEAEDHHSPGPTTTTEAPLPAFNTNIAWADCGNGFECGTLTVPVDWRKPSTDTVPLALIRHPASSPDARIGALLVNPGGPGFGGTPYLRAAIPRLPDVVKERFDLVSWDPRGTGSSRPVDCVDDSYLDLGAVTAAVPDTAETLKIQHDYSRGFARGCTERTGAFAGQIGTRNTARDLEAIRIAIGEPKLNYLGFSYGTVLGATYAQMFPTNIRAMVLDGPPDYWLPQLDYAHAQAEGFMKALDAFLGWCDESTSCALRAAGAPRDVFNQLLAQFNAAPMAAEYTVNGATHRFAHGKPLRDGGDLDAVRRVAWVADPRQLVARRRSQRRGATAPALRQLPRPQPRWHVHLGARGQRGDQLRRPTPAERTQRRERARRRPPVPSRSSLRGAAAGRSRAVWACRSRRRATSSVT